MDPDEAVAKIREYAGRVTDEGELVLGPGPDNSPEVHYRVRGDRVERKGPGEGWATVPLRDVYYQLGLHGPIGMWLEDVLGLDRQMMEEMYDRPGEISGKKRVGLDGGGGKLHLGAGDMDDLGIMPGDWVEYTIRRVE